MKTRIIYKSEVRDHEKYHCESLRKRLERGKTEMIAVIRKSRREIKSDVNSKIA